MEEEVRKPSIARKYMHLESKRFTLEHSVEKVEAIVWLSKSTVIFSSILVSIYISMSTLSRFYKYYHTFRPSSLCVCVYIYIYIYTHKHILP